MSLLCVPLSPSTKHLRDSSQERLALLEARLTEEKDWRKQLEVDLGAAQAALKKDKEVKSALMSVQIKTFRSVFTMSEQQQDTQKMHIHSVTVHQRLCR